MMKTNETEKKRPPLKINGGVIDDAPRLHPDGLMLYVYLCRHANEHGRVKVGMGKMAQDLGVSEGYIGSGRKKLETLGLIRVERSPRPNGTHEPNTYVLQDERPRPSMR